MALGWIDPAARVMSLHVTADQLDQRGLVKVVTHELCHLYCAHEKEDHSPRWCRSMARIGLDPMTGLVQSASPLDAWLRRQGW
jgi:predicted metal-dependent hydrolase